MVPERGVGVRSGDEGKKPVARRPERFRAVDRFTMAYLGLMIPPLLVFHDRVEGALFLAAVHLAGIGAIVAFRKSPIPRIPLVETVFDFYPLLLFPVFYSEVGVLNHLIHNGVLFDAVVQRVEARLFGGQPSQEWCRKWPYPLLGEYLHLGYISYYFLVPSMAFTVRFTRGPVPYERAIASVALSFFLSFLFFVVIPVAGPFHSFTPPETEAVGIAIPRLVRWLLHHGSSVGSAFPSSHVAVSLTTWIMAMRYSRKLAVIFLFFVPALALGAVYGGYHYLTDILAGAILGLLVGTLGHRLVSALAPSPVANR